MLSGSDVESESTTDMEKVATNATGGRGNFRKFCDYKIIAKFGKFEQIPQMFERNNVEFSHEGNFLDHSIVEFLGV